MIRRFSNDRDGASAVEFALVFPILVTLMFGGIALALAIWTENILQEASQEAARCIAIGSTNCATVPAGCDSTVPAICYAETMAVNRGMVSVPASDVTINTNVTSGGVKFTSVTINYTFSLIGYNYTVVGYGSFPNAS